MKVIGHKKQLALFLLAVLLPVVFLVGLTIRIVRQERELSRQRIAEERQNRVREIEQGLAGQLEKLVREEAAVLSESPAGIVRREYVNPNIVLIAKVSDTRLILPWEIQPEGKTSPGLSGDSAFGQALRQAESAEFAQKDSALAAERYARAARLAQSLAQAGYARLQRARSLTRMKKVTESQQEYEKVLALPPGVTDEYGIPIALYAAGPLLEFGSLHETVMNRVEAQLESGIWPAPAGAYLMKDAIEKIIVGSPEAASPSLRARAEDRLRTLLALIRTMEQALSLEDDYSRLELEPFPGPNVNRDGPLWVPYGHKPWLVGISPPIPDEGTLLVAVDFQALASSYETESRRLPGFPGAFRLVTGLSNEGVSLSPDFPGLSVVFGPGGEEFYSKQWPLQRLFYFIALAVVLGVTLFGAYLLWRDIRREVLLAEMRSQFVSSVSHELKTPLTAIRMFAETLRLGRSRDPEAQAEYLDTIVNESERLTRLLNNVLDFSKIEQGKRIYHPAPNSLPDIVRAAARAMEYPLKQRGFELAAETEDGLPDACVDPDAIEQAVLNLLSNAMKYSGESRWIGLSVRREDNHAVIRVADRGIGIEPKDQTRIFENFYRVPSRENQSLPGTGLGLALVAHIAKAHGGSVRVDSAPGRGSTFSIILPLEKTP
jgi:signal transduction histidine kinase